MCQAPRQCEDPVRTDIKTIVSAELIDQLLTESGGQPLDWPGISQKLTDSIPGIETQAEPPALREDPGEGYWVDINQFVPPESVRLDIESLKRGLPEDIGSGLNWSPDKKFLFLLSSLSAPSPVTELTDEAEETGLDDEAENQDEGKVSPILDEMVAQLPEMREKDAAALIEARNSVVAAWLWRKFAAATPLASNGILINPCCGIIPTA